MHAGWREQRTYALHTVAVREHGSMRPRRHCELARMDELCGGLIRGAIRRIISRLHGMYFARSVVAASRGLS